MKADRVANSKGSDMRKIVREEVLPKGRFSVDWFSKNANHWERIVKPLEGSRAEILEVGSFEGLSACYFLWRLPDAHVTCIDTFLGSEEHVDRIEVQALLGRGVLETAFDTNIRLFGEERVRKVVGDSRRVLLDLVEREERFDVVYVDGSHWALDVAVDAALGWQLLKTGGVIVFDDYRWGPWQTEPLRTPRPAIEAFRVLVASCHELVFETYQIALRKTEMLELPAMPETPVPSPPRMILTRLRGLLAPVTRSR